MKIFSVSDIKCFILNRFTEWIPATKPRPPKLAKLHPGFLFDDFSTEILSWPNPSFKRRPDSGRTFRPDPQGRRPIKDEVTKDRRHQVRSWTIFKHSSSSVFISQWKLQLKGRFRLSWIGREDGCLGIKQVPLRKNFKKLFNKNVIKLKPPLHI